MTPPRFIEPSVRYSQPIDEVLSEIPCNWQLVRVGSNKAPFQKCWNTDFATQRDVVGAYLRNSCAAIGVILGEPSDNLMAVDVDGPKAHEMLLGFLSNKEKELLEYTVKVTSGLPNRYQAFFEAPQKYAGHFPQRKVFKTSSRGDDLDFRYNKHQSVIIGHHPNTDGYYWLNKPSEYDVELLPQSLIELLLEHHSL